MSSPRTYDVVVAGAGPAGSSVAAFLARIGLSTLLLDRAEFPRDKVCGDGLTPQAVYWLDRLGCAERVLAETKACIKECDLYIDGKLLLTGGFAKETPYPDFAILLDRRRFDNILVENAIAAGATFEGGQTVREFALERDAVKVIADAKAGRVTHRGRILIGADGVSSTVSRQLGNKLKDGVMAVSVRTYYQDVELEGSQIKVYFDRSFFPGYGWLFVDDTGFANIGLGYAYDKSFPISLNLRAEFHTFVERELGRMLRTARQCGRVSGGAAAFYRPETTVGHRVLLVGDAANQADPLNGGGIHKAMEGASLAADAVLHAFESGDFSKHALSLYEHLWQEYFETDWRTAEFFLAVAKNPALRDFCLFLLTQIGRLTTEDQRFQEFASGVFSGTIAQSACLSPLALYKAFPKRAETWQALLGGEGHATTGTSRIFAGAITSLAKAAGRMARHPLCNVDWGLEVAIKAAQLAERRVERPTETSAGLRNLSAGVPASGKA